MKNLAILAAIGSLATLSAPASAASVAPTQAPMTSMATTPIEIMHSNSAELRDPPRHARAYGRRDRDRRAYRDRVYDDRGRYYEPRRLSRGDRVWRGRDGNYYCKRDNGTTGLIIGAGVGALAGRAVDTDGDRTLGTVLGAIAGGLLGREIDRGELRCR